MKRILLLAAIFIAGCTQQQSDQLTQQQEDKIKNELKVISDSIIARFERLDTDGAMQYYWDSPDFIGVNPDGSRFDFQAMKKAHVDLFSSTASLKILVTRRDFVVLTKDIAIEASVLKAVITPKSGSKMVFDPNSLTLVFQKIVGQWKVILSHQSASLAMEKAGRK